jgi:ATP-dependent Clp protease protease subunit
MSSKLNKEEESAEEPKKLIIVPMPSMERGNDQRRIGLFGELDEDKSEGIIEQLAAHARSAEEMVPVDPDNPESEETERVVHPIDFLISTYGGNADDMFAIYDVIGSIQSSGVPVKTYGLGKVMSAGVLLLACGQKGERYIGKNCRVMIHHVAGGIAGTLPSMQSDLESIEKMEERYMDVMCSETKFTKRTLKKLLDKGVNVYLSAEEAISYGIADKYI